ncbi:hypothetical protein, partial [Rhodopseudomonas palustris]|uniref:hypothetical protein n=1 Tax=Rhodopseudomonas palustris TaxID=1076 RepID=UPI001AEC2360
PFAAATRRSPGLPGQALKFNLASDLLGPSGFRRAALQEPVRRPPRVRPQRERWALTLESGGSIRAALAVGAILPPLFFGRRCCLSRST